MRFTPLLSALVLAAMPAMAQDTGHDHAAEAGHKHDHAHEHGHDHGHHDGDHHVAEMSGLRVVHAWAAATEDDHALVFMEIENTSDAPIEIEGAETEIAEEVHLVGFALVNGETTYQHLPSVPVAPGSELMLAPNGLAFELHELAEHLHHGEEFELELETSAGHVDLHVQIEPEGATQHSHAGHQH